MTERRKIMAKIKLKEDCEGPGKLSPSEVSQCQHARRCNQFSLVMLMCWCFKKKKSEKRYLE